LFKAGKLPNKIEGTIVNGKNLPLKLLTIRIISEEDKSDLPEYKEKAAGYITTPNYIRLGYRHYVLESQRLARTVRADVIESIEFEQQQAEERAEKRRMIERARER
ncbi:MAG: hypothetical protein IJS68_01425, partial [Clostridia bacterium]|nr:hypothetical protein [Clostridia bacterium]